ncbi:hypothetical protein EVAR_38080_1 [Eumeta japonica]|uniref:Uncharacterized protein n=1 Tax=Eumeta variegata TaxID=151549 RepID=A0A4C1WAZ8_EUMVA|nr:hypothetical protein EVAR_38080_1 [Eumeta japonica]
MRDFFDIMFDVTLQSCSVIRRYSPAAYETLLTSNNTLLHFSMFLVLTPSPLSCTGLNEPRRSNIDRTILNTCLFIGLAPLNRFRAHHLYLSFAQVVHVAGLE